MDYSKTAVTAATGTLPTRTGKLRPSRAHDFGRQTPALQGKRHQSAPPTSNIQRPTSKSQALPYKRHLSLTNNQKLLYCNAPSPMRSAPPDPPRVMNLPSPKQPSFRPWQIPLTQIDYNYRNSYNDCARNWIRQTRQRHTKDYCHKPMQKINTKCNRCKPFRPLTRGHKHPN